jgi:predicted O-methyltransferase YrrM
MSSRGDFIGREGIVQAIFHVGRLAEFMGTGELLFFHLVELIADDELISIVETSVAPVTTWNTKKFDSVFDFRLYRILLYVLLRATKPEIAIETGVLHGLTTLFLLRALERNGRGSLISVDLPSYPESGPANQDGYRAVLPPGRESGWIVPKGRFQSWDLRLGSSFDILPKLGRDIGEIDFFCHDSEHTFLTMWFELNWSWERLRDGGVLLCDNIEASTAFADFVRRVGRQSIIFPAPDSGIHEAPRFGLIVK